jgi:cysteine desulfurase
MKKAAARVLFQRGTVPSPAAGFLHSRPMDSIYLDNSASTPVLPAVWESMRPHFFECAGNPASSHGAGRHARRALEDARERTATLLDAFPDEVIFTSGATEANNLAVFGLAGDPPGHLVGSPIEHPCVKEPLARLAEAGFEIDWLSISESGVLAPEILESHLRPETRLVCVMLANHETGAIQPVGELAQKIAGQAAFHCDAAAGAGKMPVSFHGLGVTSLTISAHKFHGPKGIGALLLKRNARLRPQLWGGHQQQGRRPGTEPVALAVGLATALDLACGEMAARRDRVARLRHLFFESLQSAVPFVINGPEHGGIPHIVNLSFPGCSADVLLMNLDLVGVACATGSACSSGSLLPSPVLQAMGLRGEVLNSALRFSFSHLLTEAEIVEAARRIVDVVSKLRRVTDD